jgi:hypothetical protein
MSVESTQGEQFNPETPVYGIFECWKCKATRPILSPRYIRKGGDRVYHCRVCRAKSNVRWLDSPITFKAWLKQAKEAK